MRLSSLGPVIARRVLHHSDDRAILVLIGQPRRYRGGHPDYYCPYKIEGFDDQIRYAGGVDAVQALQLVMRAIGNRLAESKQALSWNAGQQVGDLGFPGVETHRAPGKRMQQAMAKVFSEALGRSLKASRPKNGVRSGEGRKRRSRRKRSGLPP